MSYRSAKKRKALQTVGVLGLILLTIVLLLVAIHMWESRLEYSGQGSTVPNKDTFFYNGITYKARDSIETVLIMGLDKFDEDISGNEIYINSQQADFLMLMVLDHKNKTCEAVHINRDTMTEIQTLGVNGEYAGLMHGQIALAHAYGTGGADSCRNTVTAVSELMYGIKIDHYISVTMDAVSTLNDLAGGVTVNVLDDFTGIDDTLIKGKDVTLMGSQALKYVRARKGLEDSSNTNRMLRQQQYLTALYEKIDSCLNNDAGFGAKAVSAISPFMVTDSNVTELSEIIDDISDFGLKEILTIQGESVKGEAYMEYYVDDNSLRDIIMKVFYTPVGA